MLFEKMPPRSWIARLLDHVRVDTAVMLAILATLMAHPGAVISFLGDLFGLP